MKIQFFGAAREVTGSKHLITLDSGKTILLDCGLFQGKGLETENENRNLGFYAPNIDYLILSHAHIDHSGEIPFLVNSGFHGTIISNHATRDLCAIMLADSGRIHESDTKHHNKKRALQGLPPVEPLYTQKDAEAAMQYFVSISYNKIFNVCDEVKLKFTDAGHILGSSVVNLTINENGKETKIAFTGDLGRLHSRILRSPQPFPQADILITESTYGDRLHSAYEEAEQDLLLIVLETCFQKKGKLIIPSFSVGRTQELLYALNKLSFSGKMPTIPVYVDSPLSVNATNIMKMHPECFNSEILAFMKDDPDPFGFNGLRYVQTEDDSKKLNSLKDPCIIISASGMMEAGRVKHHLANNIENKKNTILVVGYCAPTTLGARIRNGDKEVSIYGVKHQVRADVKILESYSAHGDYKEMLETLKCQDPKKIKKVFVVHGEYETQKVYAEKLKAEGFNNIEIPEKAVEYSL
ncbi:MAG TPA: MBL fold metallo-hydrolase [Bacteroidales bacterium]|nr:MBL fold metallo-hydrolase [Bacteroidales bacterium]HPS16269.1 MBL fold metallo-hydrolase [Bacteroidales bacterium]